MNAKNARIAVAIAGIIQVGIAVFTALIFVGTDTVDPKAIIDVCVGLILGILIIKGNNIAPPMALMWLVAAKIMNIHLMTSPASWAVAAFIGLNLFNGCRGNLWLKRIEEAQPADSSNGG